MNHSWGAQNATTEQRIELMDVLRTLAAKVTDVDPEKFVVRVRDDDAMDGRGVETVFTLVVPTGRERGLLLGRQGSTARKIRSLVRTAASARGITDSIGVHIVEAR